MTDNAAAYVPRLLLLPGAKRTPLIALNQTIDKAHRIKAVAIVIQWDDDTFDCDWSNQTMSNLCMASMTLDETVRCVMAGGEPPRIPQPHDVAPEPA